MQKKTRNLTTTEFAQMLEAIVERSQVELDEARALHHALLARKIDRLR